MMMPGIVTGDVLLGLALAVGVAGLVASFVFDGENVAWIALLRVVLVLAGGIGFGLHAFPLHHKADEDVPNFDAIALTYLLPIVLAFFLPTLQSFEFLGLKVSVKDVAVESAETAEEFGASLLQLSETFQYWFSNYGWYLQRLHEARDDERAQDLFFTFVRDRLAEARAIIQRSVSEPVRLSLWRYVPSDDALVFLFSNEINDDETIQHVFPRGRGMLGKAFDEEATWNEADVALLPSFVPIRRGAPAYQAILLTPMMTGTVAVGMLSLDRPGNAQFLEIDENVGKATATICALAMQAYLDLPGWPDATDTTSKTSS